MATGRERRKTLNIDIEKLSYDKELQKLFRFVSESNYYKYHSEWHFLKKTLKK
jgi:hypothetical protein